DERADEGRDQPEQRRQRDQEWILQPALRVLVRPEAEREPEHEREEHEAVEDGVLGTRAEEAGESHRRILPINHPAAKAVPTTATRTHAASANIESISLGL